MHGIDAIRRSLIARGLLTPDYRLTEAGNAYVDALLAVLRRDVARVRGK